VSCGVLQRFQRRPAAFWASCGFQADQFKTNGNGFIGGKQQFSSVAGANKHND